MRNTKTMCQTCSELIINTPERSHWYCPGVFIVNFERISRIALVFFFLAFEQVNADSVGTGKNAAQHCIVSVSKRKKGNHSMDNFKSSFEAVTGNYSAKNLF